MKFLKNCCLRDFLNTVSVKIQKIVLGREQIKNLPNNGLSHLNEDVFSKLQKSTETYFKV